MFHLQTFNTSGTCASSSYIIATKEYPFHPLDNPPELQGEGTSAKFVFLVIKMLFIPLQN